MSGAAAGSSRSRWLAAAVIGAAVASAALWLGLTRRPSSQAMPAEAQSFDAHFPEDDFDFDVFPTRDTVPEIVAKLRESVQRAAGDANELAPQQRAALGEEAARQVEFLLAPDWDAWLTRVRGYSTAEAERLSRLPPEDRERWRRSARSLELAPLTIGRVQVRPTRLSGVEIRREVPPMFIKAQFRGAYSQGVPDASKLDEYEVVIPVKFRTADASSHDLPAHLCIRFVWDESVRRWVPHDMTLYTRGAQGRAIMSPVF